MSIEILLKRSLPGAPKSIGAHIKRGERIAKAIQQNFGVAEPQQWQAKHLRWVIERWASSKSAPTRYDYWLTAVKLASALNHWPDWEPHLRGPWGSVKAKGGKSKGGRPLNLAGGGKVRLPRQAKSA